MTELQKMLLAFYRVTIQDAFARGLKVELVLHNDPTRPALLVRSEITRPGILISTEENTHAQ